MATLGTTALTYADWAKRQDDDGKTAVIVDLLSQANEILDDMLVVEGNLPTGHKTTVRTGLPQGTWRQLNFGVQNTKSTTAQIVDTVGNLEAYSVIDKDIADLNGNTARFRLSEDSAFFEGMGQQMAAAFMYSNALSTPAQIMGLAPRYNTVNLANAQTAANVIDMGGTGSTNTSLWFVSWGENTIQAYLSVIEQALDLLTMQAQQLAEQEGRTLQFPIVDLAPTTTLPAAVQRANMGLAFDANGNPIAGALPSVAVSSTMAPVFQAASLAAALQALGGGATGISVFQAATTAAAIAALGLLSAAQTFKSTTSGAAVEELLTLLRNKGVAGSNNDFGEALAFAMMNSADAQKTFARTYAEIIGNTAGSEAGALLWDTIQNGTLAPRMTLQAGLQLGTPTGGDKGAGSVNATGLYVNGQPVADGFSLNFAHFREQQPSGTGSADGSVAGGAWSRRTLNTTVFNSISGCSLSGSQVTVPAGTYYFNAEITSTEGAAGGYLSKIRLRDATTPGTLVVGPNDQMNNVTSNNNTGFRSRAEGRFTIAAQKAIEIDWYISSGSGAAGGTAVSSGEVEVYSELRNLEGGVMRATLTASQPTQTAAIP